jgi:cell division protein ZapA
MADSNGDAHRQAQSVAVEIYDQTYHLRGSDPAYLQKLAAMVDSKMRAVAARSNTVDSLRVAVLAAVNMADEQARLEERYRALSAASGDSATLRERAMNLSGMLDSVLLDARRAG